MPANLSFISITQAIFLSNFVFHGPVLFVFVAFIAYDTQQRKGKMKFGEMNNSLKKIRFLSSGPLVSILPQGKSGVRKHFTGNICE